MSTETIKKRLKIISDLQEEINRIKALFTESLENDPVYQEVQEEEKKIKEETKEKKQKLKIAPTIQNMDNEMRQLRKEISENKEILALELANYYKESGSLEITDEDGRTKRIVFSVRLINQ